jgi:hypothetical protein
MGLEPSAKGFVVTERDWTETHQAAAGISHVLDVVFVAAGGANGAELAI